MKKLIYLFLLVPLYITAQTEDTKPTAEKQENKVIIEECIAGNCANGKGTMQYQTGVYEGYWKSGLRDGEGKYTWANGDVYEGQWMQDKRHGMGTYVWNDGSKYKGNYSHGIRSGYGIYYYTNGTIYEGTWQNNLKHGIANFYYKESVNIGGKYINNEYVSGTGINQDSYNFKPAQ
ncbi:MORN repeat-containing protein [Aureibaculum conchae]|uniref:MORN repeat-containing protein n=1 Tax=Aureibaculum sp. 2308TA14-22 TaxID=3108392 RepID=UPI00339A5EDD